MAKKNKTLLREKRDASESEIKNFHRVADPASPRNLALSLLVAYFVGRTKRGEIKLTDMSKNIGGKKIIGGKKGAVFADFDNFRMGIYDPAPDQVEHIEQELRIGLMKLDPRILAADARYLRPMLELALPGFECPAHESDGIQSDLEFIRAFDIDWKATEAENQGRTLVAKLSGFWWCFRLATEGEGGGFPLNVALLSVHQLNFMKVSDNNGDSLTNGVQVRTILPHFTMRSHRRLTDTRRLNVDRGVVVNIGKEIALLGTRSADHTLKTRMVISDILNTEDDGELNPAGIISRPSSSGASITGPLTLCRIPLGDEIATKITKTHEIERETDESLSKLYLARRRDLEKLVGMHSKADAIKKLSVFSSETAVRTAINDLFKARKGISVPRNEHGEVPEDYRDGSPGDAGGAASDDDKGGNYSVPI